MRGLHRWGTMGAMDTSAPPTPPLLTGADVRAAARSGGLSGPTNGLAPGFVQANLVALPAAEAVDFRAWCAANPAPCPVIEELPTGCVEPRCAPSADVRTDVPRYRVWRDGALADEPTDAGPAWRDDLVVFLLGCSFSFEAALDRMGIPLPHLRSPRTVAMFRTTRPTVPVGPFGGPLVVSLRHIPCGDVARVVAATARYPLAHGAPVHVGDPTALGIADLDRPDYGDPWPAPPGTTPVFWACGVTPQAALVASRPAFAITHAPGHMLITDLRDADIERP